MGSLLHVLLEDRNISPGLIDSGKDSDVQEEPRQKKAEKKKIKKNIHKKLADEASLAWDVVLQAAVAGPPPPLSSSVLG